MQLANLLARPLAVLCRRREQRAISLTAPQMSSRPITYNAALLFLIVATNPILRVTCVYVSITILMQLKRTIDNEMKTSFNPAVRIVDRFRVAIRAR